ncbi:leucine--tRNA ligase [Candidatus Uhrbacteria bacterium CG_4_10_14_0_8_um_filter_58_22]|uniref:Leucine--tRNA ligase n=1 Tax=Candidatus Uhrbacteria bacterium CG_4_10_14_0_8_um_filter_58_22 TaxID=1975029 RepID=A0A2M7QB19_9BACT|nr:MAG: leucine--tRNA ligase [Parcubacteria group bacterium CG1_02_58_44]PIY62431.1 MAG: leucine--tRNA ligase [Candidatus Uhrbacteria bacterium CG_4_10_14_0_8_um_filter_58_22]
MSKYDFKKIEDRWREEWDRQGLHATDDDPARKKFYILDMFPYPSGNGLHVGHVEGYTATDIVARKRRMEGWSVLHPMGWDAFGLPAENYAIKTGTPPRKSTEGNIANFIRQLRTLGFSYDWSREINTSEPAYYRWTQWLFLFLYKKGLAFKKKSPVNWCTSCQTVLANEQVVQGECERCGSEVEQKNLTQWFLRVTEYADRLLDGLDGLDWPDRIKAMQVNWIGRSEGININFALEGTNKMLSIYTTRCDTIHSVTFLVVAPEHPLVEELIDGTEQGEEVRQVVARIKKQTEIERTSDTGKDKIGAFTGRYAINPVNGERVPVWVANFVLMYGTGVVMADAHDRRDFEFARKYGLPLKFVISEDGKPTDATKAKEAFTDDGLLFGSGQWDGRNNREALSEMVVWIEGHGWGTRTVNYRLHDWLVSRQRFWGAPIPILYCDKCGELPVPEDQLPVLLPDDVDFRPTGESPLERSVSFHDVKCPECGGPARRESDTMDTFVDSSWYFLRFCSPHEGERPFSAHDVAYWAPVDLYVGGAEHAVLHLLYARFFTKVLYDHGLVPFEEPFLKLMNPGIVLGENSEKMSKSRGNVVNPDDVAAEYGVDALRLYEMFMGEFSDVKPWDTKGIKGVSRFLDKVWLTVHDVLHEPRPAADESLERLLHKTVRKVSEDIEAFKFNTAISTLMIFLNEWLSSAVRTGDRETAGTFLKLLAPFAPFLAEDLWRSLGNDRSVFLESWPKWDEKLCKDEHVVFVVQVDGKRRDSFVAEADVSEDRLKELALDSDAVRRAIGERSVAKVIIVAGRLVNIVTE